MPKPTLESLVPLANAAQPPVWFRPRTCPLGLSQAAMLALVTAPPGCETSIFPKVELRVPPQGKL